MTAAKTLGLALAYMKVHPGRYLFPIAPGKKSPPMVGDNLACASNDPKQVKKWGAQWPLANWGVALSKSRLIVADVDQKPGKAGKQTFDMLDLEYGWPETETVETPSGGLHHYYNGAHVFALGKHGFGPDVDSPNYVLIPGCTLADGTAYKAINSLGTADAPDWFSKFLKPHERVESDAEAVVEWDQPANVEWAISYLKSDAPPAIEGQGGEMTTLKVGMMLRDHGISEHRAGELMLEYYNVPGSCDPEWETDDLLKKINNAYSYANIRAPGAASAEAEFAGEPLPVIDESDEVRIQREQRERDRQKKSEKEKGLPKGCRTGDFVSYLPENRYIFLPTGAMWPKESVNASVGKGTSRKLDKNSAVQVMTWCPGEPQIIADKLVDGDWIDRPGMATFNLYSPPVVKAGGDASKAGPWRDHLRMVYPADADHIERWFAHRVQHPGGKINHALVLGGPTRIGKDTLIEPIKHAVGPKNFKEVTASQAMDTRNNGYLQAVILRISEARDFGEKSRYAFYEHWKPWLTAPPNVVSVADKYIRAHPVFNVVGVIITSNHKIGGLYLPHDDARHYVAWSEMTRERFDAYYFPNLWKWYQSGGFEHVAEFLRTLDLSGFDEKAPPPQTDAWWEMVQSHQSTADKDLADVIREMPPLLSDDPLAPVEAVTVEQLIQKAHTLKMWDVAESLQGKEAAKTIMRRMLDCGYEAVRNREAKDGRWKVGGRWANIFARNDLTTGERLTAAGAIKRARIAHS